jgi:predicted nucleic acid-binding protein
VTVVVDTGALVALIDADDLHHQVLSDAFRKHPGEWVIPWAVLPEIDHFLATRLGERTARAFLDDVAAARLQVEWHGAADIARAAQIDAAHADLGLGLVDSVVMAQAERLGARAIATLDLRDFGAVVLRGSPALWPRDL